MLLLVCAVGENAISRSAPFLRQTSFLTGRKSTLTTGVTLAEAISADPSGVAIWMAPVALR